MNSTWPERLNYTIRMKGDFQTNKVTVNDESLGPHESFGNIEQYYKNYICNDYDYQSLYFINSIGKKIVVLSAFFIVYITFDL